MERIDSDTGYTIRDRNAGQTGTALERTDSDAGDVRSNCNTV